MYIDAVSHDSHLDLILDHLHNSCLQKREFVTSLQHQRTRDSRNGENFSDVFSQMTAESAVRCIRSA